MLLEAKYFMRVISIKNCQSKVTQFFDVIIAAHREFIVQRDMGDVRGRPTDSHGLCPRVGAQRIRKCRGKASWSIGAKKLR